MAYGRRITAGALRTYTAKSKRKRTANTTKVKYQRPTARNQRKQIMTNARVISKLYKAVMTKRIFCDWQFVGQLRSTVDPAGFTRTWGCFPLTDFAQWGSVLRQDTNVLEASSTYVQRMVINMRYQLRKSSWAQYNVFIVTPRKDAANYDAPVAFAAGTFPVEGQQYIEGPDAFNFRLNPAVWKVHFASYKTLTETTLFSPAQQPAGNPWTTFSKQSATIKCGINVKLPLTTGAWTELPYMQQAYHKRYFILACIVQDANPGVLPGASAEFTFDSLATTINAN